MGNAGPSPVRVFPQLVSQQERMFYESEFAAVCGITATIPYGNERAFEVAPQGLASSPKLRKELAAARPKVLSQERTRD